MDAPIRYYSAENMSEDDFGITFTLHPGEYVYDGRTIFGPWATMTHESFLKFGKGVIGHGHAQVYERQKNGQLHKVIP